MNTSDGSVPLLDVDSRVAIEHLIHYHAWLIDHGEAEKVANLFTDDGALYGVGPDKIGRGAIADWGRQRTAMTQRSSRHVHGNILLKADGDHAARGTVILTLYRHDGAGDGPATPLLIAEYTDLYQQQPNGRWLFAQRRLTILFGSA
jgi:hypothetical protein